MGAFEETAVAVSRVVVLGAGIAAAHRRDVRAQVARARAHRNRGVAQARLQLGAVEHLGRVGLIAAAKVAFPLAPKYERAGIEFVQASARELHPEGDRDDSSHYVIAGGANGKQSKVGYDFLIKRRARLRFEKTEGLGPDGGNSLSVCLPQHAAQAAAASTRRSSGCGAGRSAAFSSALAMAPARAREQR